MGEPTILEAVTTITVAVIAGLFAIDSRKRKTRQTEVDKRSEIRAKEGHLAIELLAATVDLGVATATAIKDNKVNGNMEEAMKGAKEAQTAYQKFLRETTQQLKNEE